MYYYYNTIAIISKLLPQYRGIMNSQESRPIPLTGGAITWPWRDLIQNGESVIDAALGACLRTVLPCYSDTSSPGDCFVKYCYYR